MTERGKSLVDKLNQELRKELSGPEEAIEVVSILRKKITDPASTLPDGDIQICKKDLERILSTVVNEIEDRIVEHVRSCLEWVVKDTMVEVAERELENLEKMAEHFAQRGENVI